MDWKEEVEYMLESIASNLQLGYQKTKSPSGDVYNFYKGDKLLVRFAPFLDYDGNINFLVNFGSMEQEITSWGIYNELDLRGRAWKELEVKISKLIKKQDN